MYLFITDNWGSVTGSAWTRSTVNILVQSILFNSRFFLQQSEPNSTWETVIELQSVTSLSAWLPCKRRTEKYWKSVKVCKRNQLYSDDERLYSFLQWVLLFKRDNQNALSSSKVISHHSRERKRRDFFPGTFGPTKNFHHFVWNILKLTIQGRPDHRPPPRLWSSASAAIFPLLHRYLPSTDAQHTTFGL